MPLARERRVDGVDLCSLPPLRHENVGAVIGGAADDRIVVAAETGVRIRPAGAAERRIDAVLALGRGDRLRRLRPSGTVPGSEFRLEPPAAGPDEGGEDRWAGCGDRIEIEM